MTLDQEFAQYQGQSLLVPGDTETDRGQCVQWADYVLRDVYGLPYHYGNAIDWWNNPGDLLNHFHKIIDGSIKKGDFVIFNSQVGSVYGHIDVAMSDGTTGSFQGADSNWGGNKTVHLVQHNNSNYVLGSLRLKGEPMVNEGDIKNMWKSSGLTTDPPQSYVDAWNGKDWKSFMYDLVSQPEWLNAKQGSTQVLAPGTYKVK